MSNLFIMNRVILALLVLISLSFTETIRVITIEGSTTPQIGLVQSESPFKEDIYSILNFDLTMPGYFEVTMSKDLNRDSLLQASGFYYIKLTPEILSGDSIALAYEIYDTESDQLAFPGKRYRAKSKDVRRVVHFISNDIIYSILGEKASAHTRLAAVAKNSKGKNIKIMDYDGHRPWMLTRDSHINFLPNWSPDNQSVYYTSFKPRYSAIYKANISTGAKTKILPKRFHAYGPKVSPSGEQMLFTRQQDRGSDIYMYTFATKKIKRVTFDPATETSPEWSPNGFDIAYTADRGGNPKLYKMSKEGIGSKRLTFEAKSKYLESAAWSPKGDKIAFVGMDSGKLNVYVMNINGTEIQQLTAGQGNNESPTWSPDGTMIAFSSTRSGVSQIYLMRKDGTQVTQITTGEPHSAPSWSK